jgi:hypothetical protein
VHSLIIVARGDPFCRGNRTRSELGNSSQSIRKYVNPSQSVSQGVALCNFYLTTWEEYHTGVLFLGYFNGPVEGILMITLFYFVTAVYGTSDSLLKVYHRSTILVSDHVRALPFDTTIFCPEVLRRSPLELPFPRLLSLQSRG